MVTKQSILGRLNRNIHRVTKKAKTMPLIISFSVVLIIEAYIVARKYLSGATNHGYTRYWHPFLLNPEFDFVVSVSVIVKPGAYLQHK